MSLPQLKVILIIALTSFYGRQTLYAQPATIRQYNKLLTTYPFSDPDPVANPASNIYPYFRYDGFTDKPVQKEWKIVELENKFIRVSIMPQVGGKIWSAIEKSTGRSFIYDNHVVKFRDVAMRGPWTSGGIEPNYGIIGHTPNCATPVDYTTISRSDGSVSCIIGVLDLLTGTQWRLDINLPKDKAYFTTSSFWYNATPMEQPYYSWMNTGIRAKGNLQFIYPGTHYLGHEGEYADWPVNKQNGKDISFYENNNFGGYKSYHVFGTYTDFFGAYWHDDDFGMGRYSTRDDKAGKKIWIWGLSQQGMIWEKLLTDNDGQYVEVQSGRLFNQSAEGSTLTPFKHRGFLPYSTDTWTEYWFPVKQTKGMVKANNYGALNVKKENGWLKIYLLPLQQINDELVISDSAAVSYHKMLHLSTLQVFSDSIRVDANMQKLTVGLGGNKLLYHSSPDADNLDRPLNIPADFDWNSVYGLYTQGKEDIRQRHYAAAEQKLVACLVKDPNYAPALVEWGALQYRNLLYNESLISLKKALSLDSYDPAANFYYGLVNVKLNKTADAKDGFDIAAQNVEYRSAAFTELSKLYFSENNYDKAYDYAEKSLQYNSGNLIALYLEAVIYRMQKNEPAATTLLNHITAMDPLNHFAGFEKYLWHPSAETQKDFTSTINNELPQDTYTDLGIVYFQLHLNTEAAKLFSFAPPTTEVNYWRAFLENTNIPEAINDSIQALPFRPETAEILQSLAAKNNGWKLKYHLALIWWSRNNLDKARSLFLSCGDAPAYAPFYSAKAVLFPDEAASDLLKAISLDAQQWRYHKLLASFYLEQAKFEKALEVVEPFYKSHPENYIMGMLYAKALLLNKKYAQTDVLLGKLHIIPFEGATDGRRLYHEAKLMQCLGDMKNHQYKKALEFINAAKVWPENLGVGKPYQHDIDERLEDWLAYNCHSKLGKNEAAQQDLQNIIQFVPRRENTVSNFMSANTLVTAWALEKLNRKDEASRLIDEWQQKKPGDHLAAWSRSVFENHRQQLPSEIKNEDETARILDAYLAALDSQ